MPAAHGARGPAAHGARGPAPARSTGARAPTEHGGPAYLEKSYPSISPPEVESKGRGLEGTG
jgi:hypothetical protein